MPINSVKMIQERVRCGACGGKIVRVNLVEMDYRAEWAYPISGNVLTGDSGRAVAILCDGCAGGGQPAKEVVELDGERVVYHALNTLMRLPPPPTYVLVPGLHGLPGFRCLICGRTSWNSNDVEERYCGHCHRFHDEPVVAATEKMNP